jgi:hypothetical protein
MNNNTLLWVGAGALVAYWLLRDTKKKDSAIAPSANPGMGTTPSLPKAKRMVELNINDLQNPVVRKVVNIPQPRIIDEIDRPDLKEPIFVNPVNLVPNIYDRGVGQPIYPSQVTAFAHNMNGDCTTGVYKACRCAVQEKPIYKLDIPELL